MHHKLLYKLPNSDPPSFRLGTRLSGQTDYFVNMKMSDILTQARTGRKEQVKWYQPVMLDRKGLGEQIARAAGNVLRS